MTRITNVGHNKISVEMKKLTLFLKETIQEQLVDTSAADPTKLN